MDDDAAVSHISPLSLLRFFRRKLLRVIQCRWSYSDCKSISQRNHRDSCIERGLKTFWQRVSQLVMIWNIYAWQTGWSWLVPSYGYRCLQANGSRFSFLRTFSVPRPNNSKAKENQVGRKGATQRQGVRQCLFLSQLVQSQSGATRLCGRY